MGDSVEATDEGWTAGEANELRELLGWKPEAFARRLKIHKRTALRWRNGETDPSPALWEELDKLLAEAARKLAPRLSLDQLIKMQRRDVLKLLAASTSAPRGGVDLLWQGVFSKITHSSLSHLEDISTVLASKYQTSPPHMLLGPVMGHLEKATALLNDTMQPSQRRRLQSVAADTAIFVGTLSRTSGKLAQARAHFLLAEDMAVEPGNMPLLAQVYAQQALLDYYSQAPDGEHGDPQQRVALLEQADDLARRYAPAIIQVGTSAWLAEDKAAAKDGYGADQALERSQQALAKAKVQGPVGTGFVSSAGSYDGWDEGYLYGYQGSVELALHRSSAVDTIKTSLRLTKTPRKRGTALANLAMALIKCNQPEEACVCLTEAHAISVSYGSATILHHVFSARALMPREWNSLQCVRELDERLRAA